MNPGCSTPGIWQESVLREVVNRKNLRKRSSGWWPRPLIWKLDMEEGDSFCPESATSKSVDPIRRSIASTVSDSRPSIIMYSKMSLIVELPSLILSLRRDCSRFT